MYVRRMTIKKGWLFESYLPVIKIKDADRMLRLRLK